MIIYIQPVWRILREMENTFKQIDLALSARKQTEWSRQKTILDGLKKRLDAKKRKWADELHEVLWSHRTTLRRAKNETPFLLIYSTEALIPTEIDVPRLISSMISQDEIQNNHMLCDNLDVMDKHRDQALIWIQNYQQATARYYNSNVKSRRFNEGELVMRKVFQNTTERNADKLRTNWEGPYRVTHIVRPGVYELEDFNDTSVMEFRSTLKNTITTEDWLK